MCALNQKRAYSFGLETTEKMAQLGFPRQVEHGVPPGLTSHRLQYPRRNVRADDEALSNERQGTVSLRAADESVNVRDGQGSTLNLVAPHEGGDERIKRLAG